jgi:hypothetical protein
MYRPNYYGIYEDENGDSNENKVEIIVAKNRNGKIGNVTLNIDKHFTHFSNFHEASPEFVFSLKRLKELDDCFGEDFEAPF